MKKTILTAICVALLCVVAFAQQKDTFTDSRDGKKYKSIKIGEQVWMAQNLDYHGEDGYLGLCYGDEPQKKIKKPENCKKYGRLYDWDEAMKACPEGWHLPSEDEWQTLVNFAGGKDTAGKKLMAKNGWEKNDFSGKSPKAPKCKWTEEKIDERGRVTVTKYDKCATDEYGFSALPGGFREILPGGYYRFRNVDNAGYYWSASEKEMYSRSYINYWIMGGTFWGTYSLTHEVSDSRLLQSVRCLQDYCIGCDDKVGGNVNSLDMVHVEGGKFTMGCKQGSDCDSDSPAHAVTVSDFSIGKYEVTQKLWKEVMGANPSEFKGDSLPVVNVSWENIQAFILRLNKKTGKKYRLPTEAEWEYAARGGNKSKGYKYSGSNDISYVAWYKGNSGGTIHPVGTQEPNELGIYDMTGNAREWVNDWYGDYGSYESNPAGPLSGYNRVLRGCEWDHEEHKCPISRRDKSSPDYNKNNGFGFRLAM